MMGGFASACPPRLYNQIVDDIIITEVGEGSSQLATGYQLVRLYAMVNVALADSGIAVRFSNVVASCLEVKLLQGKHFMFLL